MTKKASSYMPPGFVMSVSVKHESYSISGVGSGTVTVEVVNPEKFDEAMSKRQPGDPPLDIHISKAAEYGLQITYYPL